MEELFFNYFLFFNNNGVVGDEIPRTLTTANFIVFWGPRVNSPRTTNSFCTNLGTGRFKLL